MAAYDTMEITAIPAGWHNPKLQQTRTSNSGAPIDIKEENPLTFRRSLVDRNLQQDALTSTASP